MTSKRTAKSYINRLGMFLIPLLLSVSCAWAQYPWSGVLPGSRAIDWSKAGLPPTLPDGETTANPWSPPTRTQCGSTVAAGTSVATLNSLFAACANGTYLLLGAGNFTINSQLDLWGTSVTLRGSGPQSTTLTVTGGAQIAIGAASGAGAGSLTSDSNYAAGSLSIKIGSVSGLSIAVGNVAFLTQCDTGFSGNPCSGSPSDNGGLYVCGDNPICMTEPSGTDNGQHQQETFYVTSVTDDGTGSVCGSTHCYTIGLDHALYLPNWAYAQSPTLNWQTASYQGIGVGLEDLTVNGVSSTANFAVLMGEAYGSWMKGVRLVGTGGGNASLGLSTAVNSLVLSNYFFSNYLGSSYTPWQLSKSSRVLFINNILTSGAYWMGLGGNAGNVMAFNLVRDMFTQYTENSFFDHHAFDMFDLFEGNQLGVLHEDNTWGSHGPDTDFRNYVTCWDGPYTTWNVSSSGNNRGIVISGYQRFDNVIGNAIGTSGVCTNYLTGSGTYSTIFQFDGSDSLATNSLMRWGNVSVVTQSTDTPANSGIRFVSAEAVPATLTGNAAVFQATVPGNTTLPASFFMNSMAPHPSGGTGLSWWKVCETWNTFPTSCATSQTQPFPIAGPDASGGPYVDGFAYDNPAGIAWKNLPVDTSYQNNYAISSSSWAGGIETLNVTGLPNIQSLMGAFQLSGVNSTCTAGATFNSNNEILMTGSSSTTVAYALASNPGVSCTGAMLFPDVREFDERVYETDSAGTNYSWTVTATNGNLTGTNCSSGSYSFGTTIGACTAVPNTGYSFSNWSSVSGSAACSGSTNPCPSFSITANSAATANFTANSYTLSTATTGSGSGAITGCAGTVVYGTSYSCAVTASAGSTLTSVTGCGGSGTTTYTGTMPASNCTVTATFTISSYILSTSTTGTGSGTITGCAGTLNYGASYTCTVTPATGSTLTSVTGCGGSGTTTYTGTMPNSNCTVTATFIINSWTISTSTTGSGSGTISGCAGSHNYASAYSCTVAPATGSTLTSVTGCGGSGATTYTGVMPNSNCTVTATFTINSWVLSTATAGTGSGAITGCAGTINYGATYTCTVTPATGSNLTSVTGCGGSGTTTYTGTMPNSNCTVTATFTLQTFTLIVSKTGNGSSSGTISGTNCSNGTYNYGASYSCAESWTPGSVFTQWGGACSGMGNCTGTITANTSVSANFVTTVAQYLNLDTATPASGPGGSAPGWNINDIPADTGGVDTPASVLQTIGNSTPAGAPSGVSMLMSETTNNTSTQTNALFWDWLTGADTATNFIADEWVYISNYAAWDNMEMDFDQYNTTASRLRSFGHQWHPASGCWQYANNSSGWQNTSACPTFAGNTWHHVVWTGHWVPSDTSCGGLACNYYDQITQDGITYNINATLASESLGALPTALIDQFQLNAGATTGTPATISYNLDEVDFSAYLPAGNFTLTITATNGSVSGSNCASGPLPSGTSVGACTATPNAGYVFAGWSTTGSASCTGTGTCGPFSITANTSLTAAFNPTGPPQPPANLMLTITP